MGQQLTEHYTDLSTMKASEGIVVLLLTHAASAAPVNENGSPLQNTASTPVVNTSIPMRNKTANTSPRIGARVVLPIVISIIILIVIVLVAAVEYRERAGSRECTCRCTWRDCAKCCGRVCWILLEVLSALSEVDID
ncbi:uncharacterized protein PAE49_021576 [Odontesthes bonariensis]